MDLISDYHQPDFYRFSQDSISLASEAAKYIAVSNLQESGNLSVADFCCGCGVVLLEFIQKACLKNGTFHFYEIQNSYKPFLFENISIVKSSRPQIKIETFFVNLLENHPSQRYDLILMNPPYFKKGHGRSSGDKQRAICREYEGDNLFQLISLAVSSLKPKGKLFFVCREDEMTLKELQKITSDFILERKYYGQGHSVFSLTIS